jgi:hypothetical protein
VGRLDAIEGYIRTIELVYHSGHFEFIEFLPPVNRWCVYPLHPHPHPTSPPNRCRQWSLCLQTLSWQRFGGEGQLLANRSLQLPVSAEVNRPTLGYSFARGSRMMATVAQPSLPVKAESRPAS